MMMFEEILRVRLCVSGLPPSSFSLFLLWSHAPSFLPLLSGQELARGYNILSHPLIVMVDKERDK